MDALYKLQNSLNTTVSSINRAKEELTAQIIDVSFLHGFGPYDDLQQSNARTKADIHRARESAVKNWRGCARSIWEPLRMI